MTAETKMTASFLLRFVAPLLCRHRHGVQQRRFAFDDKCKGRSRGQGPVGVGAFDDFLSVDNGLDLPAAHLEQRELVDSNILRSQGSINRPAVYCNL